MDKLTPKQKAFADNYIISGNATEAAKKAGYKQPRQQGSRMLTNVDILEYIKQRTTPAEEKRIASGDEVLQFFTRVMNGDEKDAFGLDASLSDRMAAGREILKRNVDDRKLEVELMKLESQIKDNQPEKEAKDNFLDALNGVAGEVWEGEGEDGNTEIH